MNSRTEEAILSTTTASPRAPSVRWLIESRPPSLTWSRPTLPPSNQPPLDLSDHEIDRAEITRLNDRGVRVSTVKARWAARPRRGLPDAQQWSGALALAVIQTLLGQRSVAQLNRWVAEDVLTSISMYQRRSLRVNGRIAVPAALRSVRISILIPRLRRSLHTLRSASDRPPWRFGWRRWGIAGYAPRWS